MRQDQAMQQITRGSEEKIINSDQDAISFCKAIFSKKTQYILDRLQLAA